MKKILISGVSSGVGKTTVTTAIMSLLKNAQPFKCGPDYIDPMFHEFVTGKKSINLDLFMLSENIVKHLFYEHAKSANIAVLEGVMGLYDGLEHELDNYSAAHISRVIKAPVILVVDGRKISTSIAAVVKGYIQMDKRVDIKGIIINRVSKRLYEHLKLAIEHHTGIKCLGYLPEDETIAISERHLGLMQAQEVADLEQKIKKLKEIALKTIDINKIMDIAESPNVEAIEDLDEKVVGRFKGLRVGVAKDKAFSFYYYDNILLMEKSGMRIVYFSPIKDDKLPQVDCLYLGGGYPEVFAKELSLNQAMMDDIRAFSDDGKLIYAECGGMMYLAASIVTTKNEEYKMCGLYPHKVVMRDKLNVKRFGYINCRTAEGIKISAHEFHYSDIAELDGNEQYYLDVLKPNKNKSWNCGFIRKNTIAGYPHIHFYSNIDFFINLFEKTSSKKGDNK